MSTNSIGRLPLNNELARKILEISESLGALKYGDFTLSSGAKSSY